MILLLIAMTGVLISCNKTNQSTATTPITVADLPLKATQYIDTNYPDASIVYIVTLSNSDAAYIVTLNTTEELAFTPIGDYLGDGANYHHGGHFGGDTIHHDSIHHDSIHCDTIHGGGHDGGGHHGGGHGDGHHGNEISIDSLPSQIKDYISVNFAAYTIKHAELDSICPEGAVTAVIIAIAGHEPLKLYFDASNTFLMQDYRILYTDVPQLVKTYITSYYASYSICNRSIKLTMADNSLQYIIHLRLNKTPLTVRLKEDGTLICTR